MLLASLLLFGALVVNTTDDGHLLWELGQRLSADEARSYAEFDGGSAGQRESDGNEEVHPLEGSGCWSPCIVGVRLRSVRYRSSVGVRSP